MTNINNKDFQRIANNFLTQANIPYSGEEINILKGFTDYLHSNLGTLQNKYKVALCFICVNEPYWQYIAPVLKGAKDYFLPGHDVDTFLWSDIPANNYVSLEEELFNLTELEQKNAYADGYNDGLNKAKERLKAIVRKNNKVEGATLFPIGSMEWPAPTLMRYHLMLQQEEILKEYDYVFYCDIDMQFVNTVGDEVIPQNGITAALHPMYAFKKEYWPPYEPNEKSTAFIKRPGMIINDNGQQRFMPQYYAGGFQGGKADKFIEMMKAVKRMIDTDQVNNYVAIWNDESYWNRYLSENPPEKVLSPAYIYPDSLIDEYYVKIWGVKYQPRLVTLTKKFTTSKEGGQAVSEMIKNI